MKRLLIIAVSLSIFTASHAQESLQIKDYQHEVGLDATAFVRQFISFSQTNPTKYPYFFLYRYHFSNWALRAGVGGSYYNVDSYTSDTAFARGEALYLEFRLGVERKVPLRNRWSFYYGADFVSNYYDSFSIVTQNLQRSATYTTKNNGYGGNLFLGFRYKINSRMALTTEYNFRALYLVGHDKRTYTLNPQFGRLIRSKGIEANFSPYASLIFNYSF